MVNVLRLPAATRIRGGESSGRECPLTQRLVRLLARLVLTPFSAPASKVWRVTGPLGKIIGAEPSYNVRKDGGSRLTELSWLVV